MTQDEILNKINNSLSSLDRVATNNASMAKDARALATNAASLADKLDATNIPLVDGIAGIREALAAALAPSGSAPSTPTTPTPTVPATPSTPTTPSTPSTGGSTSTSTTGRLFKLNAAAKTVREAFGTDAQREYIFEDLFSMVDGGVKYLQPGGVPNTPQASIYLPRAVSNMWFHWRFLFSKGWSTVGTGKTMGDGGKLVSSAAAYKLAGYGWSKGDGRGTIEITNTSQYTHNTGIIARNSGDPYMPAVDANGPSVTREWDGVTAYDYFLHVVPKNTTTVSTWYHGPAGGQIDKHSVITGTMKIGIVPTINRVLLGINFNQFRNAGQEQYLILQDASVYDGDLAPNPHGLTL